MYYTKASPSPSWVFLPMLLLLGSCGGSQQAQSGQALSLTAFGARGDAVLKVTGLPSPDPRRLLRSRPISVRKMRESLSRLQEQVPTPACYTAREHQMAC